MKYKKTIIYISVVTLAVYLLLIAVSLISQSEKVLKMRSPIIIQSPFYLESRNKSDVSFITKAYAEDKAQDSLVMETLLAKPTIEPAKELSPVVEASVSVSESEVVTYIRSVFGKHADKAIKIAQCESNLNPMRVGDKHLSYMVDGVKHGESYGVFQIRFLKGRPSPAQLHDYKFNIDYAYGIFKKSGRFGGTEGWFNCAKKLNIH